MVAAGTRILASARACVDAPAGAALSSDASSSGAPEHAQTWVEVVETAADLERYVDRWNALAAHAREPNVFYEAWQLRPALSAFGSGHRSVFAFVLHRGAEPGAAPRPIGFFPWQRRNHFRGWPVRMLSAWQHPMALLSTPLLHPGYVREAWSAMLAWSSRQLPAATLLELPLMAAEGEAYRALLDVVQQQGGGMYLAESYKRAQLDCHAGDGLDYLQRVITSGVRKELRRQRRRLEELGRLELRTLGFGGDIAGWIDQFEALEDQGWKAVEATSLRAAAGHASYFQTICTEAFARRRLHMLGLFLNDRAIAMKCNFLAGDGAFALKIAFDERYAKYSPGTLLELDNIVDAHSREEIGWMDSCAVPDHPMIDRLWGERRGIVHVLIDPGGWKGAVMMALFTHLRTVKRMLRRK